jgi:hypothetical protein
MGWNFRRSAKFGPIKINFSKSGIGYSIGGRNFRVGRDAKGRTYTSTSIPGTGIYRRDVLDDGSEQARKRRRIETRNHQEIDVRQQSQGGMLSRIWQGLKKLL